MTGHARKPQDEILRLFPTLQVEEPLAAANQVLRGVQRHPNPIPPRQPGGDCFACAMYAGINHLFPERQIPYEDLYECWYNPGQPGHTVNTWPHYLEVLDRIAQKYALPLERGILFTAPYSAWDVERAEPAWFRPSNQVHWWRDLHAYLSAGWLAVAHVKQFGGGPYSLKEGEEGYVLTTDHVVLLDGARQTLHRVPQPQWFLEKYPDSEPTYERWDHEVHVVDSAQSDSTGWHTVDRWLYRHGASALHIFRRHDRPNCTGMMGPVYSI